MALAARDHDIFEVANFRLQQGDVLACARLAYKTYGTLNATRSNAILFPTWYSSQHPQNDWLIGENKALDPRKWFIVVPNLLGNGLSSSPSNIPAPHDRARFPMTTMYDNVLLQRRLLCEYFGIDRLVLAIGRSMGAMNSFQWACLFPDSVERLLVLTGAGRTSPHNYIFLAGLKAALTTDAAWAGGDYRSPPLAGLKAFGRVYAGWIYSQAWYREHLYRHEGTATLEDFLAERWDTAFLQRDANDLLAQIDTWQRGDISANPQFGGDFDGALGAISARAIVMPSRTDLYFTPEDSAYEVSRMKNAELRVIPSNYGHRAASPKSPPEDVAFVTKAIRDLLT